MRLINIGPYSDAMSSNSSASGAPIVQELVDNMRRKGQLQGVEIDFDSGTTHAGPGGRDDAFLARVGVGVLEKIREYSEMNKYDAIVCRGSMEPGFYAGRQVSKIPIAFALHSAVHLASLIGNRFSILELTDAMAYIVRRHVEGYGLGHKLISVRRLEMSSVTLGTLLYSIPKSERFKDPRIQQLLDAAMKQCKAAIEADRVDTIIVGCIPLQYLEDELRARLDQEGYREIRLICEFAAAVEMAQVMVRMQLPQAPRAYPGDDLQSRPEYR